MWKSPTSLAIIIITSTPHSSAVFSASSQWELRAFAAKLTTWGHQVHSILVLMKLHFFSFTIENEKECSQLQLGHLGPRQHYGQRCTKPGAMDQHSSNLLLSEHCPPWGAGWSWGLGATNTSWRMMARREVPKERGGWCGGAVKVTGQRFCLFPSTFCTNILIIFSPCPCLSPSLGVCL